MSADPCLICRLFGFAAQNAQQSLVIGFIVTAVVMDALGMPTIAHIILARFFLGRWVGAFPAFAGPDFRIA
jgi:hypothetical protein